MFLTFEDALTSGRNRTGDAAQAWSGPSLPSASPTTEPGETSAVSRSPKRKFVYLVLT